MSIAFALMLHSLGFGLIWIDDFALLHFPQTQASWEGLRLSISEGFFAMPSRYWRPFTLISFIIGNSVQEENRVLAQHAIQGLIFLAFASGLQSLCSNMAKLGGARTQHAPWIAPILLASPLFLDSAFWISARFDLLLGAFALLLANACLCIHASSDERASGKQLGWVAALAAACMLCKETAFTAVFYAWLSSAIFSLSLAKDAKQAPRKIASTLLLAIAPAFLAWMAAFLIAVHPPSTPWQGIDPELFFASLGKSIAFILLPWSSHAATHPVSLDGLASQATQGAALCCALCLGAIAAAASRKWIALATLLALLGLACTFALPFSMNALRSSTSEFIFSERYLTPFAAFFALMWCLAIDSLARLAKEPFKPKWIHGAICLPPILALSFASTWMASNAYQNQPTYWLNSLVDEPSSTASTSVSVIFYKFGNTALADGVLEDRASALLKSSSRHASTELSWNHDVFYLAMKHKNDQGRSDDTLALHAALEKKHQLTRALAVEGAIALVLSRRCPEASAMKEFIQTRFAQPSDTPFQREDGPSREKFLSQALDIECRAP